MLRRIFVVVFVVSLLTVAVTPPAAAQTRAEAPISSPDLGIVWQWFLELIGIAPASTELDPVPDWKSEEDPGSLIEPNSLAAPTSPPGGLQEPSTTQAEGEVGSVFDPNG